MGKVFDQTGREIYVGDVLKVFHFIGARRKKHFMYKQVSHVETLGPTNDPYNCFFISHLNIKNPNDGYFEALDGRRLADVEIVQGSNIEDRPKETTHEQE